MLAGLALSSLNAQRVEIRCDEKNVRSRAIAEKLGFSLEGIQRNDSLTPQGSLRNTAVYSIIDFKDLK
ncbi:MAG TPA: GNAT family protein [Patescibacteria group bacterium]|nr:GNAT family protein [Patescibacteria group bacterium]